jgi:2Fe-2S ferredoxin
MVGRFHGGAAFPACVRVLSYNLYVETMHGNTAITVTFLPTGMTGRAEAGDTILDVALRHRVPLEHECGGNCACTTCRVLVCEGSENLTSMEEAEADRLTTADDRSETSRLSCQAIVRRGAVTVYVVEPGTG